MKFQSTRSKTKVCAAEAILQGIAPDGGLYMPESFGSISFSWKETVTKPAQEIAADVLSALLPSFTREEMTDLVRKAYTGKFETEELCPVVPFGNDAVLELFRGPTSAFKDVALSMLPHLVQASKKKIGDTRQTVILTATSGDTGKAALEGFHDVEGTKIVVFYPDGGVSRIQRAQMVSQEGKNVFVSAIRGNFDDAQTGVKEIFARVSREGLLEGTGAVLSSANSINIGRLAPQVMYYFKAYGDLARAGRIQLGDEINFVVPTGNFGDILAGYFAKLLGLPVKKLICASNENNVLTDFIETGLYDRRRPFHKTTSPSMDILVSSNLERLLFLLCGQNEEIVAGWMKELNEKGSYRVSPEVLKKLQSEFDGGYADSARAARAIRKAWEEKGYLMDPHTAVAAAVLEDRRVKTGDETPAVILSTASPYKFSGAVLSALGEEIGTDEFAVMERLREKTGVPIPAGLAALQGKKELHPGVIDREAMMDFVLQSIRA